MTMQRLILTPKSSSPLGALPMRPEIAKFLDPKPDIDLVDIRLELEEIEREYAVKSGHNFSLQDAPGPGGAKRFGGNVSEVANFGRGGFHMRLLESDLYSDDENDDTKENNRDAFQRMDREDFSPLPEDAERLELDWAKSPLLPRTDQIETALREVNRERLLKVQEEIRQTQVSLEEKYKEEQQRATTKFAQLKKDEVAKCERARRSDKQDQRLIAEARDQHLSVLQRDHEQRSQVEERAIRREAAAEEARRREVARLREQQLRARQEAEAEAKKKAEAEREKLAAEAAKRKAQADAAAKAALQRAEAEKKTKAEAEQMAKLEEDRKAKLLAGQEATKTVPRPRISEDAAKLEDARLKKLMELEDSYKQLLNQPDLKKELKAYERQLVKHLQQVSATQEQVRKKSAELIQLFRAPNGPPTPFLIVTFGTKLLSQCESQVQKLPSFAFALAQVVVNVASQVPFLMESVLAQLHQVCIFTVPKYYVFSKVQFGSDEAYYKALGYREEDGKLESTDAYVARMNAYITFYAAVMQTEVAGAANPHGLANAWSWCTRLLNKIPTNRLSASALESFLKIAGFRLFQAYPKPFMKLMQVVVSEFLVSLKGHDDADARATVNRLETYLHTGAFRTPPEGRNMPTRDMSSELMG